MWQDLLPQKPALLALMEMFDLLCPRIDVDEEVSKNSCKLSVIYTIIFPLYQSTFHSGSRGWSATADNSKGLFTNILLHLVFLYPEITIYFFHHIKLYFNIIHQNKSIKHNKILRTWSKGQNSLRQSCPNKGFNKYTETYKNTLYTQRPTDKNTQERTRHAPKWNQLYSDNKTDFSWFWKCLVVLHCFIQIIPKRRPTISNCTIRKHFLCFINPNTFVGLMGRCE